jgi:hypothetical protein
MNWNNIEHGKEEHWKYDPNTQPKNQGRSMLAMIMISNGMW